MRNNIEASKYIKKRLSAFFPKTLGWKFQVRKKWNTMVEVVILESPITFGFNRGIVNHYIPLKCENANIMQTIVDLSTKHMYDVNLILRLGRICEQMEVKSENADFWWLFWKEISIKVPEVLVNWTKSNKITEEMKTLYDELQPRPHQAPQPATTKDVIGNSRTSK